MAGDADLGRLKTPRDGGVAPEAGTRLREFGETLAPALVLVG